MIPVVSIIIPAYNPHPNDLYRTFNSILRQRGNHIIETIIVDDESTLDWDVQSTLLVRRLPIKHGGPSAARNAGIERANSCNLLCLDVGDELQPYFLERTLPLLRRPEHIIYASTVWKRLDGRILLHHWGDYSLSALLKHNYMPITSLFTKETFEAVRAKNGEGFDTKVAGLEDWLFWIEAGLCGFYGQWVDDLLFIYNESEGSRNKAALEQQEKILQYMNTKLVNYYNVKLQAFSG